MTASIDLATSRSRAWAEIDLKVLESNARALASFLTPDQSLMAVIKADAYGHGLLPVAQAALRGGAAWLGVATVAEGRALRADGVTAPIALLCTAGPHEAADVVEHRLTPMVGDPAMATALGAASGRAGLQVHLDIDTGMGRSGAQPEQAVDLWRQCVREGLAVSGICTHFADADGAAERLTRSQWTRFNEARRALAAAGAQFDWVHAMNSPAAVRLAAGGCNLARIGLLLYGLRPDVQPWLGSLEGRSSETPSGNSKAAGASSFPPVRPVLALKARVGSVRDLPAGHTVSYGAACKLSRPSRVATVLIGYGDGYPRRLSSVGEMLLRGERAPILGRVCMDQTVIDVTHILGVSAGDVAVCIGADGGHKITAEALARRIQTTEHEITTCLTSRLPRVYISAEEAACAPPEAGNRGRMQVPLEG